MNIRCKCGNEIVEGEIDKDKKGRKIFCIKEKPKGTIIKNKSKNPYDWTGICSSCQGAEKQGSEKNG